MRAQTSVQVQEPKQAGLVVPGIVLSKFVYDFVDASQHYSPHFTDGNWSQEASFVPLTPSVIWGGPLIYFPMVTCMSSTGE